MDHSVLWSLTLGPIVEIYKVIFEFCHFLTQNYGISLLLLSAVTSVLMIPLGKWASKVIAKQKKIEDILRPQILRIKESFQGAERHEAIGRLYKRYRYNPLQAALGATGVLIQLPFLIGAFYMLSEFTAIHGVSFGPIRNLAEPDRLLENYINLLPIIMTVINLASTYLNQTFTKQEKRQASLVAFLFFVLLYKAPSALLIYWTCNNLINLGKVFLKRISNLKLIVNTRKGLLHNLEMRIDLRIVAFAFFLFLLSRLKWDVLLPYSLYFKLISDLCFLVAIIFCLLRNKIYNTKYQKDKDLVSLIIILLLTGFSIFRFIYVFGFNGSGYKLTTQLVLNFFLILAYEYKAKIFNLYKFLEQKRIDELFLPIGVLVGSLIFIYFPFLFYNSDPNAFIQSSASIIKGQILFFEISILIILFLNFFLGKFTKALLSIIIFSLILAAFVWNIWNDPKLGAFANYQFQNEKILTKSSVKNFYYIAFGFCFLISSVVLFRVKKYVLKTMISMMILGVCISPLLSYDRTAKINLKNNENQIISEELNEFLTFSKNEKNIIVIMLDMFSPSDLELLLRVDPNLNKQFSGFTWYKDTLSSGISTIFGKAPLLGGLEATPWKLNEDKTLSLEEKVNTAWSKFFNILTLNNFQIELNDNKWYSWFDPKYYNNSLLSKIILNRDESILIDRWDSRNNFKNEIKGNPSIFLSLYGLFKISPLNLKNYIYDKGMWLGKIDRSDDLEWSHRELPLLDALSNESHFKETSYNKFKFISTLLTHHPWNLNEQCKPSSIPINEDKYRSLGIVWNSRLQSELCSLQLINEFLNKLKRESAFENTMVLIVSDHGFQTAHVPNESYGLNENMVRDGSLLLVKPFGNNNLDLKISHDLTTNYDVPIIIENALSTLKKEPWKDKNRRRTTVHGDWQRDLHPNNYYNIKELYSVKGSMFDANNWHKEF